MADAKGNQEPSMEEILASIRRIISEDGESKDDAAAPAANGHDANGQADDDDDDALVLTDMVVGESNVVELKEEAPEPEPAALPPLDVAIEEPAAPEPVEEVAAAEPPAEPAAEEATPAQAAASDFESPEAATPEPKQPEPAKPEQAEPEPAEPEMDVAEEIELEEDVADRPPTTPALSDEDGLPATPDSATPGQELSAEAGEDPELVSANVAAASAATMAQLVAKKASAAVPRYQTLDGLLVETLVRQAVEPMLKDWLDEHLQEIVERLVRREVERLSRKAELS